MSRFSLVAFLCLVCALPLSAQRHGGGGGFTASAPRSSPGPTARTAGPVDTNPVSVTSITTAHVEDEKSVTFRSQTVLILVPTVVTDKSGAHVSDLKRDDFTILENGKPRPVVVFQPVSAAAAPAKPHAPLPAGQFTNVVEGGNQPMSTVIVVLDCVNTSYLDQRWAREQLVKFLATRLQPGQPVGLLTLTSRGVQLVYDFSSDPAPLIAALKKVSGGLSALEGTSNDVVAEGAIAGSAFDPSNVSRPQFLPNGRLTGVDSAVRSFVLEADAGVALFQQENAVRSTMESFLSLSRWLASVPGRKSLIWVTGGFPFYMDSPSAVPGGDLSILYERAMQELNNANVAVYPVDARGLVNYMAAVDPTADHPTGPAGLRQQVSRSWLQSSTIDTLNDFAAMTGGHAFYNTNDLVGSFDKAAQDSSSYYLLGYYLDTTDHKPGWRKLKVKVDREHLDVRARSGFFVSNSTVDPDATRRIDIAEALTSPLDNTEVPILVSWTGTSADGEKRKVEFSLKLPPDGFTVDLLDNNHLTLDIVAVAHLVAAKKAEKQKDAGQVLKTIDAHIQADHMDQFRAGGLTYSGSLDLPPGNYEIRFVVRDDLSGRVGSLSAPLAIN